MASRLGSGSGFRTSRSTTRSMQTLWTPMCHLIAKALPERISISVHCHKRHTIPEAQQLIHVHVTVFQPAIGEKHCCLSHSTGGVNISNHRIDPHPAAPPMMSHFATLKRGKDRCTLCLQAWWFLKPLRCRAHMQSAAKPSGRW